MNGIFDYHAHYDDAQFDGDREETLHRVHAGGVEAILNAGSDLDSSRASVALAQAFPFVYATAGVHPHAAHTVPADYLAQLETLAAHPKVVALGEMGLDYYYTKEHKDAQLRVFEEQLALAVRLGLPVVIHDRDAHQDTLDLLTRYRPAGVVHCYSGSAQMARQLVDLGFYIGFTGAVTFKNARKAVEAAAAVPLDRLLTETDCPYMAPEPHRGRRCDSSLLPHTITVLAGIKGVAPQEMARVGNENARRLFAL